MTKLRGAPDWTSQIKISQSLINKVFWVENDQGGESNRKGGLPKPPFASRPPGGPKGGNLSDGPLQKPRPWPKKF